MTLKKPFIGPNVAGDSVGMSPAGSQMWQGCFIHSNPYKFRKVCASQDKAPYANEELCFCQSQAFTGPPEECSPFDLGWNNCGVMKSSSKLVMAKSLVVVVQASRLVAVNLSQSTCLFRIQCSKQLVMPQCTQLAMQLVVLCSKQWRHQGS